MSAISESVSVHVPKPAAMPAAAVEVLLLYASVVVATLFYTVGWLTPDGGVVFTTTLLVLLLGLSWRNFNQGRHPCFLFLAMFLLLQGGRLLTFCLGAEDYPLRIAGMSPLPFDMSRRDSGLVLLCVALSAICVYAPCRLSYRPPTTTSVGTTNQYLPFLYLIFFSTIPLQVYKNYKYYAYVQDHGGYLYFFINHGDVASTVPWVVRGLVLLTLPTFLAIFVFETRKRLIWLVTALYFGSAALFLLMGARGAIFTLILTLWYVSSAKSKKRSRRLGIALIVLALVLVGDIIQALREDTDVLTTYKFAPVEFVKLQGNSLDVTDAAVAYRSVFAPYAFSYLWNELKAAFVANDASHYSRGKVLAFDLPVFLDAYSFSQGRGTGSSYLGEAYVIGGTSGVVIISLLIGLGLRTLYELSRGAMTLFVVSLFLPDVLTMPRGALLDWLSVLLKMVLTVGILIAGWKVYLAVAWLAEGIRPRKLLAETSR